MAYPSVRIGTPRTRRRREHPLWRQGLSMAGTRGIAEALLGEAKDVFEGGASG
jgi:hypothetical protein